MAARLGKDGLTVKQRKLALEVAKGKTLVEAARAAGYSGNDETIRVEASRTLKKPHVSAAIDRALTDAGLSVEAQAQVVADAARADKVAMKKSGEIVNLGADHSIRLDAAKTAGKWRGHDSTPEEGGQVMGIGFFVLKGAKDRGLVIGGEAE